MSRVLDSTATDPVRWIQDILCDPENEGRPFQLYPAEERFLREALTLNEDGRLPFPELVFSAPKKSGKTALAAMATIYVMVALAGKYGEAFCLANDLDQSVGRVFQSCTRILNASPLLANTVRVTSQKIEFIETGGTIQAVASDFAGAAGANPNFTVFDELWGYTSERSRRLWDEMVPPPTRKVTARLTVTYAGFEGESELLEDLYKRGLQGVPVAPDLYRQSGSMLMYWTHLPPAPWQTEAWLVQMRQQLRASAYLRMIENRFVSGESDFLPLEWWDACVNPQLSPVLIDLRRNMPIWIGVDASTKKDSTAIVACTFDQATQKVRLVWHRTFQPSASDPLDFEATIETTLLDLKDRFREIREVRFDPWQMISSAQRLTKAGLPMTEFPQSVPNLTEASQLLYDLVKGKNLIVYPDAAMRLAVSRAVAKETSRGWRIGKEKQTHKIDVVVALAQACLGAVRGAGKQGNRFGGIF